MYVEKSLIEDYLNREIKSKVKEYFWGLINSNFSNTISYCAHKKYLEEIRGNKDLALIICDKDLIDLLPKHVEGLASEDPVYDFFQGINVLTNLVLKRNPSLISESAFIHPSAYISEFGVEIGDNTWIGPNVNILNGSVIGRNCTIRAGATIGSEGLEYKRTSKGIVSVKHNGQAFLGDEVDLGANACIDKGFSFRNTVVGKQSRVANLVQIAHGAQIGERCAVAGCSLISGSATIMNDVWIGPNSTISHGITIEDNAKISLGSVVTRNVKPGERVTGNFALNHSKFISNLKNFNS